ncbi:hypothetical protein RHGRI_038602 [Rhododendron griersonianum]|uniref:Uncharacterized protein n=1 Tax=Rhododendron griersonianum TaxID=479676 RepID=A0AAV6HIV2_9ERIC|nr:hypothetical protein RHGRI_038602 [Rhododendron griersonianum]
MRTTATADQRVRGALIDGGKTDKTVEKDSGDERRPTELKPGRVISTAADRQRLGQIDGGEGRPWREGEEAPPPPLKTLEDELSVFF